MKNFKMYLKNNKGYSLIVLIIAIIVILLLAMVSVVSLRTSREKTEATNFIYDLRAVEEAVRNFYTSKGTLPTASNEVIDIYSIATGNKVDMLSQLSNEDDEVYYYIDLSQLQGIAIKDATRGYIVNRGSQNVYVTTPLEYKKSDESAPRNYYTLTGDLINGKDVYASVEEDIEIVGNPISWSTKADLRMILPKRSLSESNWNDWDFRFSIGPKSQEEMENPNAKVVRYKYDIAYESGERLDVTNIIKFDYGDMITIRTNGTYTFYIKEPDRDGNIGNVTLKNINVSMIDDIKPKYEFSNGGNKFLAVDNETGIREIRYKTLDNYISNKEEATGATSVDPNKDARTNLDYFLMDGKGKDLINELKTEIKSYIDQRNAINNAIIKENGEYNKWITENPLGPGVTQDRIDSETARHNNVLADIDHTLNDLNARYAYLKDLDGNTSSSRLVICIIDNANNAIVVGETNDTRLTTRILADAYNISLSELNNL